MSTELPFPPENRLVTLIAVVEGEPTVVGSRVVLSRPNLTVVDAEGKGLDLASFRGTPATLLYGDRDFTYVLRGRISEVINGKRLIVSTPHAPRPGERREFIRANVMLDVRVEAVPEGVQREADLSEYLSGLSRAPGDYRFHHQEVDLSGSGLRMGLSFNVKKAGYCLVSVLHSGQVAGQVIHLGARVVRCRPRDNDEFPFELAAEFVASELESTDTLINLVFAARAQELELGHRDDPAQ